MGHLQVGNISFAFVAIFISSRLVVGHTRFATDDNFVQADDTAITVQSDDRSVRSDDPQPLKAVVQQLAQTFESLQAQVASQQARIQQLEAENQRHVAFSAYITYGHGIQVSAESIIPFHSVITNVGDAYNPATSGFTAPYDGEYFFSINLGVTRDYKDVSLRRNNVVVAWADKEDTVSTHLSMSCVVTLRAGDTMTVNHGKTSGSVDSGCDSVFTGFWVR